ncbi:MAG: hypothetical protein Q4D57_05760 [Clostridia bacterium]|nr:hypothetical protein [Clostridia bacterium]
MEDVKNLDSREKISMAMLEDKDFCLSIVNCKDRDEVREFLLSKGIEVDDSDIDDLAKNISEIADICQKLDEDELNDVAGGKWNSEKWGSGADKAALVAGVGMLVVAGLGILSVVAAGIKKKGDEKGWWGKKDSKKDSKK